MKLVTKLLAIVAIAGVSVPAANAFHEYNYKFNFELSGSQNVSGGDPDGMGMAEIIVDGFGGMIWWDFMVENIAPITMDHIHKAGAGSAGPVVFNFNGMLSGSAAIDTTLAQDLINNSSDYYVNLHNQDFPAGAIRGQFTEAAEVPKQVPDSVGTASALIAISGLLLAHRVRRKKAVAA